MKSKYVNGCEKCTPNYLCREHGAKGQVTVMDKPSHTPTPWYEVPNSGPEDSVIFGDQGDIIVTPQCSTVNAAFIVKCVNSYELAVKLAKAVIRADAEGSLKAYMPLNMAQDFLAQASGK